ncbi:MAG: hypothetical protein ACXVBE_05430 [Bdellovibrionota bacterium]
MQLKNNRGQGVLMTVLMLGVVMSIIIMFGAKRQTDVSILINRLDASQTAYEVLSAASKRVQTIYANEASCDPGKLNQRISRLERLPAAVASLGFGSSVSYAVAQTITDPLATQLSALERSNRCTPNSGTTGCRQVAINLENLVYVVTVGNVVATSVSPFPTTDCPQDVLVRLSVAINSNVFTQWVSLINVCTLTSCAGDSFSGVTVAIPGGSATTAACAPWLASRNYGNITSAAAANAINSDDLRWGRRYLETGGADIGETTYMDVLAVVDNTNKTCTAASTTQCFGRNCVPAFDLNRDKTNNEADLAILELYLRGYLLSLPASYLN